MAAQVVQEAPGGGDDAGRAVDGLGGGAGRGSLHTGYDRGGVGDQVAGSAAAQLTLTPPAGAAAASGPRSAGPA